MKIRTAHEFLAANFYNSKFIEINSGDKDDIERIMQEYAAQFIDLAANQFNDSNDTLGVSKDYVKITILKIKEQIK